MLEETKNELNDLVIDLHDQARAILDPVRSLEMRKVADEISDIVKRERDAIYRL